SWCGPPAGRRRARRRRGPARSRRRSAPKSMGQSACVLLLLVSTVWDAAPGRLQSDAPESLVGNGRERGGPSAGGEPAVHEEDLARHVVRRAAREEQRRPAEVRKLAVAPGERLLGHAPPALRVARHRRRERGGEEP